MYCAADALIIYEIYIILNYCTNIHDNMNTSIGGAGIDSSLATGEGRGNDRLIQIILWCWSFNIPSIVIASRVSIGSVCTVDILI